MLRSECHFVVLYDFLRITFSSSPFWNVWFVILQYTCFLQFLNYAHNWFDMVNQSFGEAEFHDFIIIRKYAVFTIFTILCNSSLKCDNSYLALFWLF